MARYLPYRWGNVQSDANLLFHAFGHVPGVHTLSPFLTINSQTEETFCRYKGGDASLSGWPAWNYGIDLDYQSGTAPDFQQKGPCLGPYDLGVKFNDGGYFYGYGNQIDTEDFVFEFFGIADLSAVRPWMIDNRSIGGIGYNLNFPYSGNDKLAFYIQDSSGLIGASSSSILDRNFFYFMFFCNRDEDSTYGARLYYNGILDTQYNFSAHAGSLTNENPYTIGARYGVGGVNSSLFFLNGWKAANWLPAGAAGPAEYEVIAAERFYRLSGIWPTKAVGTWAPTVATRAFGAYMENQDLTSPYTKRIYQVGSEHLRVQRAMVNGSQFIGFRAEPQTTNLISESEDLATTWASTRCTISQDAIDTPDGDGRTVVDGIVATVDDDTHYIEITPPFANGRQHVSIYAQAGDVDWIKIESTVSGGYAYFDLVNKQVGTMSGLTAYIDDTLDGDWCHFIVREVWVATDVLRISPAYDDLDDTFPGDGSTVSVYVWGVQAEDNYSHTSLINTDGATATRLGDQLRYKGDDGNIPAGGSGRATFKVLFPEPISDVATTAVPLLSLSDGGSVDDRIEVFFAKSEFSLMAVMSAASGGSAGQAALGGDPRDGAVHNVEIRWKTDYLAIAVDGIWSTADTDVDIPDDLDRIEPLQAHDGTLAAGVLISDLKIWKW